MGWITPHHTRWFAACLLVLLLSVWAGGLSFSVVAVFAIISAAGAALLSVDFPVPVAPEPEPFPDPVEGSDESEPADTDEDDAEDPVQVA